MEFQRNSCGFLWIPLEFHWNEWIPAGFHRNSCGFHWNSAGMTGFLQDSCRNRWGTVKYWSWPSPGPTLAEVKFSHQGRPQSCQAQPWLSYEFITAILPLKSTRALQSLAKLSRGTIKTSEFFTFYKIHYMFLSPW